MLQPVHSSHIYLPRRHLLHKSTARQGTKRQGTAWHGSAQYSKSTPLLLSLCARTDGAAFYQADQLRWPHLCCPEVSVQHTRGNQPWLCHVRGVQQQWVEALQMPRQRLQAAFAWTPQLRGTG